MKYWYFISVYSCPVCGKEEVFRERRYTPRPNAWEDRHYWNDRAYDWCNY
jgi:hypothetical protein